jgi:hypothetical protein
MINNDLSLRRPIIQKHVTSYPLDGSLHALVMAEKLEEEP